MNRRMSVWLAAGVFVTHFGCGGGGGEDASNLPGVWSGFASMVERGCPDTSPEEQYYSFTHLVNQSEADVVLENGARTYAGTATSVDGFRVEATAPSALAGCIEKVEWRYEKVTESQAPFIVRKLTLTCAGREPGTCSNTWTGNAFRAGGATTGGGPVPLFEDASASPPQAAVDGRE